jgi:transcriptional regulator with XRE-family HTH domain
MLRKATNKTQVNVAKALNVGQDTISRYEQRTDMLLSTLQSYVQAMGGQLELIARFPNRKPLLVNALEELSRAAR